jgi:hypothetical protein
LLVACALLVALPVSGCGGGGSDTTAETTVSSGETVRTTEKPGASQDERGRRSHVPAGDLCQSQLGGFVGSMDGLRRRLAVGVTYDQYLAEVRRIDCLTAVATPGEKAFNRYIEAANDWGECVSELGCGSTEIEPALQRRWRVASHFLSEAQDGLRA